MSITNISASHAESYYTEKDNYYVRTEGAWTGKGSEALCLEGGVSKEDFKHLLAGKDAEGNVIVAPAPNGEHRAGIDLTFSAPKSVSILAEVLDVAEVRKAHDQAVGVALRFVESHFAHARFTEDGKTERIDTGNLVIATFAHDMSREMDPQLHTHAVVLNATETAKGWRALSNEALYENKMLIGQVYRNELAANLKDLGFAVLTCEKGLFEVEGVPASLIERFSQRSEQIAEKVVEIREAGLYLNAKESKLREIACLGSRVAKKDADPAAVREAWNERLRQEGLSREDILQSVRDPAGRAKEAMSQSDEPKLSAHEYVQMAADALTRSESTFSKEDALKTAARFSLGENRIDDLERAFADVARTKAIIALDHKRGVYTTRDMLRAERDIIRHAKEGRNAVDPVYSREQAERTIDDRYGRLTPDQKNALQHLLTAGDRVILVQGDAGTGKTTMLAALRQELENAGYRVQGLSFTGKAAQELEKNSGIESRTLHAFLSDPERREGRQAWVVDESSMVGSRQMHDLVKHAKESDARLVLIGDTKQLQSIDAGRMFRKLQEAGLKTVRMTESVRQKDETYRDIVRNIAEKRIDHAFDKMEETDRMHVIADRESRLAAIVNEYVNKCDVENTLVVTALNRDRKEINGQVREELKRQGRLDREDHVFLVREPKTLNAGERHFARNYEPGDIVTVNRSGAGIKVGAQGVVTGASERDHTITVRAHGAERALDLRKDADKIAAYVERPVAFTEGEKVVFLKNDKKLGVANGLTGVITNIGEKGELTFRTDADKELAFNINDYNYLDHGYAVTDYKAQGQTAREVIFHADTERGVSFNSFYVAVTRGRDDVHVYTNDRETLQEQVKEEQEKTSTLDYPDKSIAMEESATGVERESGNGERDDAGKEALQERENASSPDSRDRPAGDTGSDREPDFGDGKHGSPEERDHQSKEASPEQEKLSAPDYPDRSAEADDLASGGNRESGNSRDGNSAIEDHHELEMER